MAAMTLGSVVGVLVGLTLGLLGPRAGRPLLSGGCALFCTLLLCWRAGVSGWSFLATALAFIILVSVLVWLVVRVPRVGLVPTLLVAL